MPRFEPAGDGRGAGPQRGACTDILRWPATHRSAAGYSRGDQEVFDTDGVLFDKADLQEAMVAGLRCASWMMRLHWNVMLQQLGVGQTPHLEARIFNVDKLIGGGTPKPND